VSEASFFPVDNINLGLKTDLLRSSYHQGYNNELDLSVLCTAPANASAVQNVTSQINDITVLDNAFKRDY